MTDYIDHYPTCETTYATLCIYPGAILPDVITARLQLEPSSIRIADAKPPGIMDRPSSWFLTSKSVVDSKDVRRHVDWILSQIANKSTEFDSLQEMEVSMSVSCYWVSASGHGGPTLSPSQMSVLARLGLDIEFDIYLLG